MATIIGAAAVGFIIQGGIFKLLTKRDMSEPLAIALSAITFVVLYSVIGAFGAADGGPPNFAWSISVSVPASLIVSALLFLGIWRRKKKQKTVEPDAHPTLKD